jgi:protein required for attachment to host cells
MVKAPSITWIAICDGARACFYANSGPGTGLVPVAKAEHPASRAHSRDLGTDRPGRSFDSTATGARHSMAPRADWHNFEKDLFARKISGILDAAAGEKRFDRLILVAPPRILGDLRKTLGTPAQDRITGELDKDLTNIPPDQLGAHLGDLIRL